MVTCVGWLFSHQVQATFARQQHCSALHYTILACCVQLSTLFHKSFHTLLNGQSLWQREERREPKKLENLRLSITKLLPFQRSGKIADIVYGWSLSWRWSFYSIQRLGYEMFCTTVYHCTQYCVQYCTMIYLVASG